ncbi:MAG: hypothetical protein QN193_07085 [Armatimonadota bacterium]|nr:hypothetical protein [Armatimonadota bacterium]MDR7443521.1 hypothetical protein [Armatimonadota bacterium]MDR7570354.1 hypothetical protein [Armatimonadota bacterium]MDR7615020.1 hypothetical protein [Armatimonadota bacterium]
MIHLLFLADTLRRAGQRSFGRELDRARFAVWVEQWYPGWLVREKQRERLGALVAYAREASSFYRERLLPLSASFSFEDYARTPPLTRAEVERYASRIRTGRTGFTRGSGGTGGRGLRIPVDRSAYAWYLAGTWRGLRWWGTDFTERGVVLLGPGPRGLLGLLTRTKDWVMNWLRLPVDRHFEARIPHLLRRIRAYGPAYLYAFPSAAHALARRILEGGEKPPADLKVAVLTGEPLYTFQRREIEEAFGCPAVREYGSGEVGCLAFECPRGTLHLTAESVYLETLGDPALPQGGRILVTSLHNRGFPLLRYEIGDVGHIEDTACPCGRALPAVRALGRVQDLLIADGEVRFAHEVLDRLFELLPPHLGGRVRIRQRTSARLTVEASGGSGLDLLRARDLLKDLLGPGWQVEVDRARIDRLPSGKVAYFARDHAGPFPHQ